METVLHYMRLLDDAVFLFMNGHHWRIADEIMPVITLLGDGVTLVLLSAVLLLALSRQRDMAVKMFAAYGCSGIVVQIIKHAVHRLRPPAVLENVHVLGPALHFDSFPSGHTAAAFTVAAILAGHYPTYSRYFFGTALMVGYSRIYLGAHFPLDVVIGACIGMTIGKLVLSVTNGVLLLPGEAG